MNKKYVVYQHVTPDGMYYFGQTQNVEQRWKNNGSLYKGTALQPYIEKFGWDNIKHIVLFKDQTRENALWIENFLIETAREDGVCINKQRSGLISKEEGYQQDYYKYHYKEYYEENKDRILGKKKQYYERNKGKFKEYQRKNKDKINEYHREYYKRKKLEKQLKEVETTLF